MSDRVPASEREAALAKLLCEGRNHDHEWAVCYDSQRLAEFVSHRAALTPADPSAAKGK
jgi:hypothetical protein